MSTDIYSYAVIGIPVEYACSDYEQVKTEVKRGCDHLLPEGASYCPECGKKAVVEEIIEEGEISPYDVVDGTNLIAAGYDYSGGGHNYILGIGVDHNAGWGEGLYASTDLPTEEEVKEEIESTIIGLRKHGWDALSDKIEKSLADNKLRLYCATEFH